jgi:hypothetical protein
MAKTSRPYSAIQSILVTVVSVAGPLSALWLVVRVGFNWPLFIASVLVSCVSLFSLCRTWRAPFAQRALLRLVAAVALFTALFSVLWAWRS